MFSVIQIESKSNRLKRSCERSLNRVAAMSFFRYAFLATSLQAAYGGDVAVSLCLIALALMSHKCCYPHAGYRLTGYKKLSSGGDFVPLKHWMVASSRSELTDQEYQEVLNSFTEITKQKVLDVVQKQRILTLLDAVNFLMYDLQFARSEECRLKSRDHQNT